MVIGTAEKPRCFNGWTPGDVHVVYYHNKTAWMQRDLFVKEIRSFYSRRAQEGCKVVVLITDNAPTHALPAEATLVPPAELPAGCPPNMRVYKMKIGAGPVLYIVFLPPNCTSICQPLDQGILHSLKAAYRKHMMRWLLAKYKANQAIRDLSKIKPDVKNAITWASWAWQDMDAEVVRNCSRAAGILDMVTVGQFRQLEQTSEGGGRRISVKLPASDVAELSKLMQECWQFTDKFVELQVSPEEDAQDPLVALDVEAFIAIDSFADTCAPVSPEEFVAIARGQAGDDMMVDSDGEDVDDVAPKVCTLPEARLHARALLAFACENRGIDSKDEAVLKGTPVQCLEKLVRGLERMVVSSAAVQQDIRQLLQRGSSTADTAG